MSYCDDKLTQEETDRNKYGPMLIYTYTPTDNGEYWAPEYFPTILSNHTELELMSYDDILIPKDKLVKGAHPGTQSNLYYPGFPTMKHLKYRVCFFYR